MYNLTDTYWLGKIGTAPMAAISLVTPLQSVVTSFGQGVTAAGSILISQYIGAGDWKNAKGMVNQIFLCSMLFSVVCAVILFAASPALIVWLGAEGELRTLSQTYLQIVVLDMPFLFMINIFSSVNQAQGDTVSPMLLNLLGIVLNLILDPLFMMVFGWGIAGAAAATLLAKVPCAVIAFFSLNQKARPLYLDLKTLRPEKEKIKKIVKIGLPTAIGSSTMQFGFLLMTKSVLAFGGNAMAAYGIGNKINGLVSTPSNAIGSATSTIVGQNIGANQIKRAEKAYRSARAIAVGFLLVTGLVISRDFVSVPLVRVFSSDEAVIPMAAEFLSIMSFWCWANGIQNSTMGLFNGSGKTMVTMLVDAARLWIFRFATLFFCQHVLRMGVESVWYCVVLSNGLSALVLWILYKTRIWEKDTLKIRDTVKE